MRVRHLLSLLSLSGAIGSGAAAAADDHPVILEIGGESGVVSIRVVAIAGAAEPVSYDLEVHGASRVSQKGKAVIRPDRSATLAQVRLSPSDTWTATLMVVASGGSYTIARSGGGPGA